MPKIEDYTSLYNSLQDLYIKAYSKVKSHKEKGRLITIPYEKINVIDLKIDYDHTSITYDWDNAEYFDHFEWSSKEYIDFMDNELKVLPEFDKAAEDLWKSFPVEEKYKGVTKSSSLPSFLRHIMKRAPNEEINKGKMDSFIKNFIGDYKSYFSDNVFTWHIQVWVGSFHFEGDSIKIGDYLLRKPRKEELPLVQQRSHYVDEYDKYLNKVIWFTSILEFSMRDPKDGSRSVSERIVNEIENCIDVFRLFKVGNATIVYQSVTPTSALEYGNTDSPESPFDKSWLNKIEPQHTSKYQYEVKKAEEELFKPFFLKIKPALQNISPKTYLKGNYIDLAFHRYKDSLLRSEVNVNRMVSAITCLEALLSNSSTEITYKISLHVAGLLRFFGFDPVRVFKKMKIAYSIRSSLLHGSKLSDDLLEFSKNYTHEIVNYARICLLVSLQLKVDDKKKKKQLHKDELIDKIDYSFLDDNVFDELNDKISKEVYIPIVYPYRKMGLPMGDELTV